MMSRFDIFANPGKNRGNIPFVIDVQSNVISGLATRVVVPLRPLSAFASMTPPPELFPIIDVNGEDHVMDTPQLAAIPSSELKSNVGSARSHQFEIQSALDRLFGAY
jgi:toxin CcdB